MGFLSSIGGLLQQYAAGNAAPAGKVEDHFDQAAQTLPSSSIASGLAAALGSGGSANFAQMATQLFTNGNGGQQASMINTLLATAGPEILQQFLGGSAGGGAIGNLIQNGQTSVSADEAAAIPPEEVQALAEHVHKNDPSIVDRLSEVYSEHPTLIKSLGAIALGIAMKKISESHHNA
jgi:hypothetical protein